MDVPVVSVIMAGGSGERFWPLSRIHLPKQLLPVVSEKPMLLEAVELLQPLIPRQSVWIATGASLMDAVKNAMIHHPPENIIGEPMRRNTTGCLVYAAAQILARYGDEALNSVMAVTTADHSIADGKRFREVLEAVIHTAYHDEVLVTIGIQPSRPETGYGYIETGKWVAGAKGLARHAKRFCEKPDRATAGRYLRTGRFLWNAGIFIWSAGTFDALMRYHAAIFYDGIASAMTSGRTSKNRVQKWYKAAAAQPIDKVLIEKLQNAIVLPAHIGWDDIGSWEALRRMNGDESGSLFIAKGQAHGIQNSIIRFNSEFRIAVRGIRDLIAIQEGRNILLCHREYAADIKDIRNAMEVAMSTKTSRS